jgi:hypothetical protein
MEAMLAFEQAFLSQGPYACRVGGGEERRRIEGEGLFIYFYLPAIK